jgi:hypothetical protein
MSSKLAHFVPDTQHSYCKGKIPFVLHADQPKLGPTTE